jgi:Protein of unknown function (DUF1553)/Protein of unknown function (DUF1549)/Planctomycete cytochrome C/EF-hand domain pair
MLLLFRVGVLGLGCLIAWFISAMPDLGAQQPNFDPEKVFRKADANGDGKISREEWKKFRDSAAKLKDNAKSGDFLFDRLDTNQDGFLTIDEFKKIAEIRAAKNGNPKIAKTPDATPEKPATAEQIVFFEKSIRPVLVKECYSCHSATAEKIKGGLSLDTRSGLRQGGETGPAIVAGNAKASLLIKAIKQKDDDTAKMPPKKKLADEVIADFEKWVAMGAADPRENSTKVAKNEVDIQKGRQFWAFQPVKSTTPPAVKNVAWPHSDIDRFLLAEMEAKGLKPAADADPRTLIRRLNFDLIGLPPTPEQVEAFVKEYQRGSSAAVEKIVDELESSPQFGERWGRHWLDAARYAESSGRSANFSYPQAWRYRDYVIAAFNADKPFDQFIREQLAGDLLPAKDDKQKAEFLIATGFLAIGPKTHNERNPRQFQMDVADEQIDATFEVFQALTVACARCHDHKFDPIPQKDYYALSGIFRSSETCYGTVRVVQNNQPSSLITLPKSAHVPLPVEPLTAGRRKSIEKQIKDLNDEVAKATGRDGILMTLRQRTQIAMLESQLASYEIDGTPRALAMGVRERSMPADSRVFNRGELDQPGELVKRGFPQVLTAEQPSISRGSGRKELADWIASKENPLTARVMANRVWLHLIGRGLVATPDNFGASGEKPSHPALLDFLATSFVKDGWSVKKLIRSIVLSRAYQMSSQFDEKNFETDPDNILVWRMPKRRLEAEAVRDSMLAISGRLDLTPPTGDIVAQAGEGNAGPRLRGAANQAMTDSHRTVYLPIVRDQVPEMLTVFDFPDPSLIVGERAITTIAAQSLFLMNNPFVIREAQTVADKLLVSSDSDKDKLKRAYQLCYSRPPTENELENAQSFLAEYGKKQPGRAAWIAFCQALFASAEFGQR